MKILLLAPYCGGSHQAWAEGYVANSAHEVTLLSLPSRFWKWRMQGAAVTLAERARALDHGPGLILATDMLNLSAFLALTRDVFAGVPTALYCHENQLTYPMPPGETRDLTYGMINWLSMLVADRILFNSGYHLKDWFSALPNMLKHFPDYSHLDCVDEVRRKATVLPVGVDLRRLDAVPERGRRDEPPVVLWNQRWEYDKDPGTFFRALYELAEERVDFRVVISGQNYRETAPEFKAARDRLGDRVIHFGYAEDDTYAELLRRADIVVSTATHEFFGVAVVEATYSGCFPVLPNRLSYPELIPKGYQNVCLYEGFEELLARLRWALTHPERARSIAGDLRPAMRPFDWAEIGPVYDRALASI